MRKRETIMWILMLIMSFYLTGQDREIRILKKQVEFFSHIKGETK